MLHDYIAVPPYIAVAGSWHLDTSWMLEKKTLKVALGNFLKHLLKNHDPYGLLLKQCTYFEQMYALEHIHIRCN